MVELLLATDADWIFDLVSSALAGEDARVNRVGDGRHVLPAASELKPDLVICDLQVVGMGGVAICHDLRLESGAGRLARCPVLILLDREADIYIARKSEADGWLIKPLDSFRLRMASDALLGGGSYYESSQRQRLVQGPQAGLVSS